MKRSFTLPALLAAGSFSLTGLFVQHVSGAIIFWTGGAGGAFENEANWSNQSPGSSDTAIFSEAFAGVDEIAVNFSSNVTNEGLGVVGISLDLDLGGNSYTLTDALTTNDADLFVFGGTLSAMTAAIDSGFVDIADDAAFITQTAVLGGAAGANAQIDIAGSWENETAIVIGNAGTGEMNIGHDGTDSTGVGGEVSTTALLLGAASGGQGTVNIGENATLQSESTTLGVADGANGTVNVGEGASWTNTGGITAGAPAGAGGSGEINVEDDALLRTQNLNLGSGQVTQLGSGTIVIADTTVNFGDLNQTVQNRINNGGLFVANDGLMIMNGGTLEATAAYFDSFSSGTRASVSVMGNGSLLDLDGGDLIVGGFRNGSLIVSGGARVESGDTVVGDRPNGDGSVTVTGTNGNGDGSLLNVDGDLTVGSQGVGELTIASGGHVAVAGQGTVGATSGSTGTVTVTDGTFEVGDELTLGYVPSGAGAVSQRNVNATLMVMNGGVVVVDGGGGDLVINGSGLLGGNGTIDGNVRLSGRISSGSPTGSITVGGNFQTNSGSILQIQYTDDPLDIGDVFPNLDPGLVNDLLTSGYIAVEGQATLADGTVVEVVSLSGNATPGDSLIILHAEGGGMFPMLPPDLDVEDSFLVHWISDLITDNGEQYIMLTAVLDEPGLDDFRAGLSGNFRRVADALSEGGLFGALTALDPNDPEAGLRSYLPLQQGAVATQNIRTSQYFHQSVLQEMTGRRTGLRSDRRIKGEHQRMFSGASPDPRALAQAFDSLDQLSTPVSFGALDDFAGAWGGFIGGLGIWDRVDSAPDRTGYRAQVAGVHGGVHYHLTRDLLLGVSAAYLWSDLDFSRGAGDGEVDTVRGGPYLSWSPAGGDFFLDVAASYGYHRNDLERETLLGTARSRYDAHDISVVGQVGYDFVIRDHTVITPLLGLEYTNLRSDSATESGAGLVNLRTDSMTTNSMRMRLGGRVSHAFDLGEVIIAPELSAGWAHELLDDDIDVRSRFAAAGPEFTTRSGGIGRNTLEVSAGFTAMAGTYMTLYVRYEGAFQSDRTSHGVLGGLGIRF